MAEWVVATTDEEIDAAIAAAQNEPAGVTVARVEYHSEPNLDLFVFILSDGRRLSFPRENLQPVANATKEQSADVVIQGIGYGVWWPQVDEGLSLEGLLEGRTGNAKWMRKLRCDEPIAA